MKIGFYQRWLIVLSTLIIAAAIALKIEGGTLQRADILNAEEEGKVVEEGTVDFPGDGSVEFPEEHLFFNQSTVLEAVRQGEVVLSRLVKKVLSGHRTLAYYGASNTRYQYNGLADFLVQKRWAGSMGELSNCLVPSCNSSVAIMPVPIEKKKKDWKGDYFAESTKVMNSKDAIMTCDCGKGNGTDCENRFFLRYADQVALTYHAWWRDNKIEGHFKDYDWSHGFPPRIGCSGHCLYPMEEESSLFRVFDLMMPNTSYAVLNLGGKHKIYQSHEITRVRDIMRAAKSHNVTVIWKSTTTPRTGRVEERIDYRKIATEVGIGFYDARATTDRLRKYACSLDSCESIYADPQHLLGWVYLILNVEMLQYIDDYSLSLKRIKPNEIR